MACKQLFLEGLVREIDIEERESEALMVRKDGKKGKLVFVLIEQSSLPETALREVQQELSTVQNVVCLGRQTELSSSWFSTEEDIFLICDAPMGKRWRKNYPDSVVLLFCSTNPDETLGEHVDYVLEEASIAAQLRGIILAEQSRRTVTNRRQYVETRHSFDYTATGYVLNSQRTHMLLIPKGDQWFPPGGHVEPGEYPDEALLREIREETGYTASFLDQQVDVGMQIGDAVVRPQPYIILLEDLITHYHYDFLYLLVATEVDHIQANTATPEFECRWVALPEIEQLEVPEDVRWVVKKLIQSCCLHRFSRTGQQGERTVFVDHLGTGTLPTVLNRDV